MAPSCDTMADSSLNLQVSTSLPPANLLANANCPWQVAGYLPCHASPLPLDDENNTDEDKDVNVNANEA